jgi:DNA polymerase-3 subunit epsilon
MIHQLLNITRPLFVVDTETTGVDVQRDRIVEIGFQEWDSTGMIKEWRSIINPIIHIPQEVVDIHGISNDVVKDWPPFKNFAYVIAKAFSNCDFAGKNPRFDLRIIASEMQRSGVEWNYVDARIIDADRLEQLAVPRSLSHLHEKYTGAPHEGAHGALSDVRASTTVIVGQLQMYESLPRDMDALHAAQWPGWIDGDGKFRFVKGVPCFAQWGKYGGMPMTKADKGYWDFILMNDFASDVKELARRAKLGQFPTMKKQHEHEWRVGTTQEFPVGYVGCSCGAIRAFEPISNTYGPIVEK